MDKIKVLVVDDEKIFTRMISLMLDNEIFQCECANNGLEAYIKFENNPYSIIIMDVNMPILDGVYTTKKIKSINPNIPVICLSSYDKDMIKDVNIFDGYLQKPVYKDQLNKYLLNFIYI